jgi:hypothetical protein
MREQAMDGTGVNRKKRVRVDSTDSGTPDTRAASTSHTFPVLPTTPPARHASPGGDTGLSPPPPKRSKRVQEKGEQRMQSLLAKAGTAGPSAFDPASDITPHLFAPLKTGLDGRLYTDTPVRRDIERQVRATSARFPDLASSNLPKEALALRQEAQSSGKPMTRLTTRGDHDGFRSGQDLTYTENTGLDTKGTRSKQDTPRPRSPSPERGGLSLTPQTRYEDTHQNPFRFTGLPGNTVHGPTQANQVVDTHLERFITGRPGSFLFREDTFTHSRVWGARVDKKGGVETQHASYRRRLDPPAPAPKLSPTPDKPRSRSPSPEPKK